MSLFLRRKKRAAFSFGEFYIPALVNISGLSVSDSANDTWSGGNCGLRRSQFFGSSWRPLEMTLHVSASVVWELRSSRLLNRSWSRLGGFHILDVGGCSHASSFEYSH